MGTENTNQDTQNAGIQQDANKTFTQAELNKPKTEAAVRRKREKAKGAPAARPAVSDNLLQRNNRPSYKRTL